jgi:segregation and condensation protein B
MSLQAKIESLLFVATKPMSVKKVAELTGGESAAVEEALNAISQKFNTDDNGIHFVRHAQSVQFVSSPLHSKMITEYLKEEQAGDLTRPALETLTIIAYRGPMSKVQLDTIRGVNCALILRNLMVKGLIEAKPAKDKLLTSYHVSMDFVRFLGLHQVTDLPDYERLHSEAILDQLLNPVSPVQQSEADTAPAEVSE